MATQQNGKRTFPKKRWHFRIVGWLLGIIPILGSIIPSANNQGFWSLPTWMKCQNCEDDPDGRFVDDFFAVALRDIFRLHVLFVLWGHTLHATYISPENGWLEDDFVSFSDRLLVGAMFQGVYLFFSLIAMILLVLEWLHSWDSLVLQIFSQSWNNIDMNRAWNYMEKTRQRWCVTTVRCFE